MNFLAGTDREPVVTTSLAGITSIEYEADGLLEHIVDSLRGATTTVATAVSGLVGTVIVAEDEKED